MSNLNSHNSYGLGLSPFAPPKSYMSLEQIGSRDHVYEPTLGVRDLLEYTIRAAVSIFPGRFSNTNFQRHRNEHSISQVFWKLSTFLGKLHDITRCHHFLSTRAMACESKKNMGSGGAWSGGWRQVGEFIFRILFLQETTISEARGHTKSQPLVFMESQGAGSCPSYAEALQRSRIREPTWYWNV